MNITRQQQLLSRIKRIVSTELQEIDHEKFHRVVVTDVLLSNDGRVCRVWVDAPEDSVKLLNTKFFSEIQRKFTKQFVRKIVPKLEFHQDKGEITMLDKLLEEKIDDTP